MANHELILIVDDEVQIHRFLKISLESNHYQVMEAYTAGQGLEFAASYRPNIIILDLGLPDRDGLEVLRSIRSWSEVPIIILSAKNSEDVVVAALDMGADDYLTKPFNVGELLARIRVCLRKHLPRKEDELFCNGELEVNITHRIVKFKSQEVALTNTEYDLLRMLIKNAGKVITHQQLLREIWGPRSVEQTQYLRVYVGYLRQKIEANPARPQMLITESGIGYRLKIIIPTLNEDEENNEAARKDHR